jgi:hypothetical protein
MLIFILGCLFYYFYYNFTIFDGIFITDSFSLVLLVSLSINDFCPYLIYFLKFNPDKFLVKIYYFYWIGLRFRGLISLDSTGFYIFLGYCRKLISKGLFSEMFCCYFAGVLMIRFFYSMLNFFISFVICGFYVLDFLFLVY